MFQTFENLPIYGDCQNCNRCFYQKFFSILVKYMTMWCVIFWHSRLNLKKFTRSDEIKIVQIQKNERRQNKNSDFLHTFSFYRVNISLVNIKNVFIEWFLLVMILKNVCCCYLLFSLYWNKCFMTSQIIVKTIKSANAPAF